jgi:diketogulonate reductase-like aldo/keto reductase
MKGNLDVLGWKLSDDDMAVLDTLATQCRMVDGSFWQGGYREQGFDRRMI